MINSSIEELSQLSDVGQITANKIKDYFLDNKNIEVINKLKEYGLNTYSLSSLVEAKENYFKGKRFVLTDGTISVSRDEMTKRIESLGGISSSSVSKNTDFVLAGESAGSKLTKFQELNIKIFSEEEIMPLIIEVKKN